MRALPAPATCEAGLEPAGKPWFEPRGERPRILREAEGGGDSDGVGVHQQRLVVDDGQLREGVRRGFADNCLAVAAPAVVWVDDHTDGERDGVALLQCGGGRQLLAGKTAEDRRPVIVNAAGL